MSRKSGSTLIHPFPLHKGPKMNPTLLRVIVTPLHTKVDFGYVATDYYINGGWIRIDKDSFIEEPKTRTRYKLTRAENIPIAPAQHDFESSRDWCYFSLYFEPIPPDSKLINIVEDEFGNENDFNYYGVKLDVKKVLVGE